MFGTLIPVGWFLADVVPKYCCQLSPSTQCSSSGGGLELYPDYPAGSGQAAAGAAEQQPLHTQWWVRRWKAVAGMAVVGLAGGATVVGAAVVGPADGMKVVERLVGAAVVGLAGGMAVVGPAGAGAAAEAAAAVGVPLLAYLMSQHPPVQTLQHPTTLH